MECPLSHRSPVGNVSARGAGGTIGPSPASIKVEYLINDNGPPRCPSCGGELEWKADLPLFSTTPDTKFFQCENCDRFHTVRIKR